jgi:2-methylcitrate dehydratase PrpD
MHTKQTKDNIACFVEDVALHFLYELALTKAEIRRLFMDTVGYSIKLLTAEEAATTINAIFCHINNNKTITYCHEEANATIHAAFGLGAVVSTDSVSHPVGV